jgi:transposase
VEVSKDDRNGTTQRKPVEHLPVINPKVAGIDLAAQEHWVCGPAREDGKPNVERFGTRTHELEALADWLKTQGVESVAMESTGVYWIPVYELLESRGFEVVLVNARQLSHVPGRKTDMQDCQWLQVLHSCGLLRGSFRPGEQICALRALHRQYATLVSERSRAIQWMQKALDQMNVQVHRAVSDLSGKTGLAIVRAIVAGERDAMRLAQNRDYHCRKSVAQIATYLKGNWREEHLFNLKMALRLYDQIARMIEQYEAELAGRMEALQPPDRRDQSPPAHPNPRKEKVIRSRGEQPQRTNLWRFAGVDLTRIDGLRTDACRVILTEIGPDLSAFPNEKHFVSWLRLSPRTAISGGKALPRRRNATGATRIAAVLRMAALAVGKTNTALGAAYRRLARRKGANVAVFATARRLAVLIYRMLRFGQDYVDEGLEAYEARFKTQRLHNLRSAAKQLGYQLVPAQAPA